jgi:hypothetical protein
MASVDTPPIDGTGAVGTCATTGESSYKPFLSLVAPAPTRVKTKSDGAACTGASGDGVHVTRFMSSGTADLAHENCTGLLGSPAIVPTAFTVKWKTDGTVNLTPSTVTVTSSTGGVAGDGHGTFDATGSVSAGSFAGDSFSTHIETDQTAADIGAACSGKGLKQVTWGEGPGSDGATGHGSVTIPQPYTVCPSGCPYTNLQDAINAVEASTIDNPITVAPGDYTNTGNFAVTGTVDIQGAGTDPSTGTVLDGQNNGSSVIFINGSSANLTISGVDITNGLDQVNIYGGISNVNGTLTVDGQVAITGNGGADGGGIGNSGTVTFDAGSTVTISNNLVGYIGGGISNAGTVTFDNGSTVTISGNLAEGTGVGGGGIANSGTMTFDNGSNVSITGNTASGGGSGLFSTGGAVTFDAGSNVSITGNTPDPQCDPASPCP